MLKNFVLFITAGVVFINTAPALADEILNITPVKEFTTCKDNVFEGDSITFQLANDAKGLKKGDIITGYILNYEPNGFCAKEAKVTIGKFRTENGRSVKGTLYISGSEHSTLNEFCNKFSGGPTFLIRGGEIKLVPQKDVVTILTE